MNLPFEKYQATGNDFVIIDQRSSEYLNRADTSTIRKICDRRFGIGADGLILLELHPEVDFEMIHFNSDGNERTMCGNGGRCIVKYANTLGLINSSCEFLAIDGVHKASINAKNWVELQMIDVNDMQKVDEHYILNTGSPHYVEFREDVEKIDIEKEGARIRYSSNFKNEGINVNFAERNEGGIFLRTYERGVEGETLSCGTGAAAAALAAYNHFGLLGDKTRLKVNTPGGAQEVKFRKKDDGFSDIWLCGPADHVFSGEIDISQI